jgi:hypothetical protein
MAPYDFRPSVLVHMGNSEQLAASTRAEDPGFAFVPTQSHYDGVYYYAIGRDPLARGTQHRLIDLGSYRYGHPGFGWLGWLASAGQAKPLPYALLAVTLACAAIAGAVASLLAADLGLSPWFGLAVALNPGLVFAVTELTSEAAGLAALLVSIFSWRRERRIGAALALTAACLIKEQLLLVPLGLAIYELVRWLRACRAGAALSTRSLLVRLAPLAAGPLVYVAWFAYVWWQFLVPPTEQGRDFISIPFTGWIDTFERAETFVGADFSTSQLGAIEIPLLVAIGSALVIAGGRAIRLESEVQAVFLLLALTVFSLNWWNLLYPKDFLRQATMVLVLLPLVFAPSLSSRSFERRLRRRSRGP